MEKASKWIQNFLLGKREEKDKKRVLFTAEETPKALLHSSSATPNKEKRRWSFKKSSAATDHKFTHKSNRSFDEIYTAQLVKQVLQEQDIEQIRIKAVMPPSNINEANNRRSEVKIRLRKDAADQAATKIQSVFRSYLARRALRALRALVKLQALVRGHLVRKQTNAVLRSMHALMTIQVRARFKRVQMADHPMKSTVLLQAEKVQPFNDINQESRRSTSRKKGAPSDDDHHQHRYHNHHPQVQKIHGFGKVHSGRLSISKQENHNQICNSTNAYQPTDDLISETTTNQDQQMQIEEIMTEKEPQHSSFNAYSSKTKKSQSPSSFPHTTAMSTGSPLLAPSYMSDTESSKAKTRSQSEPKRRPKAYKKGYTTEKGRRSTSTEGVNWVANDGPGISVFSQSRQRWDEQQNHYPWLFNFKLYRSAKPVKKECDADSSSVTTSNSNKYATSSFTPFEPPVNLY